MKSRNSREELAQIEQIRKLEHRLGAKIKALDYYRNNNEKTSEVVIGEKEREITQLQEEITKMKKEIKAITTEEVKVVKSGSTEISEFDKWVESKRAYHNQVKSIVELENKLVREQGTLEYRGRANASEAQKEIKLLELKIALAKKNLGSPPSPYPPVNLKSQISRKEAEVTQLATQVVSKYRNEAIELKENLKNEQKARLQLLQKQEAMREQETKAAELIKQKSVALENIQRKIDEKVNALKLELVKSKPTDVNEVKELRMQVITKLNNEIETLNKTCAYEKNEQITLLAKAVELKQERGSIKTQIAKKQTLEKTIVQKISDKERELSEAKQKWIKISKSIDADRRSEMKKRNPIDKEVTSFHTYRKK